MTISVGDRFGQWTVVSRGPGRRLSYKCSCACGSSRNVNAESLVRGVSRSCGCLQTARRLPHGEVGFRELVATYRRQARNRNLAMDLSEDEIRSLTGSCCWYCGASPSRVFKVRSKSCTKETLVRASYTYNEIDRVDSSIGYSTSNCVPCCAVCNGMKSDLSLADFLKKVSLIA